MNLRLEKAEDCFYFKLFDPEDLTDWVNAGNPGNWTLTLDIICNCDMAFPTIDVRNHPINADSVEGWNLVIAPQDIGLTETSFPDGVYSFILRIARPNGSSNEDTVCSAILCQTYCEYIEHLAQYPNSDVYKYIESLEYLESCDECDCKYGCAIFKELIDNLNNPDDAQKDPCNCK